MAHPLNLVAALGHIVIFLLPLLQAMVLFTAVLVAVLVVL
jgi:hypothetical protein